MARKLLTAAFAASLCSMLPAAHAAPVVLDPTASLSVFDTGGTLNPALNGGFTLGGLEVTAPGTVFVVGGDGVIGTRTTLLQLISSTGLGTAATVGPAAGIALNSRGYELASRTGSTDLYVAGTLTPAPGGPGTPGIHGLDSTGGPVVSTFAVTSSSFATSGLSFDAPGTTALVSTDGTDPAVLPNGVYTVPAGGPEASLVGGGAPPAGISPTDDHVVTAGGKIVAIGDGSHDIWDVTGGAGSVVLLLDLDTVAGVAPSLGVGGVRAALDPVSGDIFMSWGLPIVNSLIRVKSDFSTATLFATSFGHVRDLDFGAASSGIGTSLWVSEHDSATGIGTIYEIALAVVPEPGSLALVGLGIAALGWGRRRA